MVAKRKKSNRAMNPLLIISLFLSLTELAMLVAATQVTGPLQWVFGVFSIAFASVVATIFFFLLWKRNQILYSPKDFADRDAIQFVRAMHVSRDSTVRYLDNVEREQEIALRKAEIELELLQRERGDRDRRLQIEIQLEMLKTMAARGALDDDGTMTRDLTLKLLDSLTSDAASSASGPRPEIEGGSVGGFDSEEDPDSKNDD